MRESRLIRSLSVLLFLFLAPSLLIAQMVITGRVVDEQGEPLPGAQVTLKSTGKNAITGNDGKFRLNAPGKNNVLRASFIGFNTREVSITSTENISIALVPDVVSLAEAVVNVGYGTARKSDITGAVSSVNAAVIAESGVTSVEQVLQGRVAGVQMTNNTGMPGGGSSIQIRGLSSINSTNEPIYVIDGVIIPSGTGQYTSNAFSFINPADIESIEILKDASASAIYGTQAANGVILITTKKGKSGAPRLALEARYGVQSLQKYLDLTDLREYAEHSNALNIARGNPINAFFADPSMLSGGTDWQREIFSPAAMSNYNLSVMGGSDATTYKLTGSYLNQDGAAVGSGFDRFTVSTGIDSRVKPWLKIGGQATVARTSQTITIADYSLINSAVRQSPAVPVRNLEGDYGGPEDVNDQLSNPLALAELIDRGNKTLNLLGNVYAEVKPWKWLTARTEFSTNLNNERTRRYVPTYALGGRVNNQIENQQTQRYSSNWTWRNLLTVNRSFAKIHTLNAVAGYEITDRQSDLLSGLRYGGSNQLRDLDAGDVLNSLPSGNTSRVAFNSVFGRVNYSLNNRYVLTGTLRYDGSSNFAEGYKWGLFPSAAFAWRISEESFLKPVEQISNLKLRLGYGKVGNSNVRAFSYTANMRNVPTVWGTGQVIANVPNPEVTWETTSSYNLGMDLGLFNNKIEFVADLYSKRTDDLLLSLYLPAITGTSGQGAAASPWANVGSLENKGFELSLNTTNISRKDFKWTSNFVFTLNRNKVLELNSELSQINKTYQLSGSQMIVTRTEAGRSIGNFYGYRVTGRINSAEDIYDAEGNVKIAIPEGQKIAQVNGVGVGDLIFDDYNKDGVINEQDRQYIGSPLPDFTFGFGSNFTYKNFDFNFFFQGTIGNEIMNFLSLAIDDPRATGNLTKRAGVDFAKIGLIDPAGSATDVRNLYVSGGDAAMPRLVATDVNESNRLSSRFIENGSYLRLQSVNLGYRFSPALLNRFGLSSARLNVGIQNLFTIHNYSGYDPEVGMARDQYSNYGQSALLNGVDTGRYPTPRNITFGLSVGL